MTVDQMIEVLQAHKNGKQIEYQNKNSNSWIECTNPIWSFSQCNYRIKQEPRHFWVNIYPNQSACSACIHNSQRDADIAADSNRIECIEVVEVVKD